MIKTAEEIVKEILYYPVTNNQDKASIAKGVELIEQYADQFKEKWIPVSERLNVESYYQLAFNDDVYLDIYHYRPKGIDCNSSPYFRCVNDNSTMDISEVSHCKVFNVEPPIWAIL